MIALKPTITVSENAWVISECGDDHEDISVMVERKPPNLSERLAAWKLIKQLSQTFGRTS